MHKDFLDIIDYTPEELQELIDLAVELKKEYQQGGNQPVLKGKVLAMIFQKPSLRTRVSFEVGMYHLGGNALYLSPNEIGLGQREAIADVARVLDGMVHGIMARVFDHEHLLELAHWTTIPVINGLSDYSHPCQALADVLTIYEEFGQIKDINITYVGDGNNVAVSLMQIAAKLGANFTIANPIDYDMPAESIETIRPYAEASGSKLTFLRDPHEAVKDAKVIYTDTWTSMGQEEEAEKRRSAFDGFQVNSKLLCHAPERVIVMHCLPAHRGEEITGDILDGPHSVIFDQAENRIHAAGAVITYLLGGLEISVGG